MRIIRRLGRLLLVLLIVGAGLVAVLVVTNTAPEVPALSAPEAADRRPYLIKLHAQWCPVCMVTRSDWTRLQDVYTGKVKLVVFDFTSEGTTDASRAEAARLGLSSVFEEWQGVTGITLLIDGSSKELREVLDGSRSDAEYLEAIDRAVAEGAAVN